MFHIHKNYSIITIGPTLMPSCQDRGDATFCSLSGAAFLDSIDTDHCTFWPSRISCSLCIICATLTFGPLNHFLADRTHQMQTKTIGTPYTTTVQFISSSCKFAPVTLGKQRIGTMSMTKAEAMVPVGMEKRPRFQGPGRKRLPTKKTRIKIGVVKALNLLDFFEDVKENERVTHTKAPIAPMLNNAPIANSPPKMSSKQAMPTAQFNHTALTGVCVCLLTCLQTLLRGKQSSLAYAKVTRLAAIMHP